jgi:hypothetical protein
MAGAACQQHQFIVYTIFFSIYLCIEMPSFGIISKEKIKIHICQHAPAPLAHASISYVHLLPRFFF